MTDSEFTVVRSNKLAASVANSGLLLCNGLCITIGPVPNETCMLELMRSANEAIGNAATMDEA